MSDTWSAQQLRQWLDSTLVSKETYNKFRQADDGGIRESIDAEILKTVTALATIQPTLTKSCLTIEPKEFLTSEEMEI